MDGARPPYELELDRLRELARPGARVLVQMPFGLRRYALEVVRALREAGATAIIHADPCYGACDLPLCAAEVVGADLVVHYGHSKMVEMAGGLAIHYFEARMNVELEPVLEKALELLRPYRSVGLATTVQHIGSLEAVADFLRSAGHEVRVGRAGGLVPYDGQVLGCDFTTARAVAGQVDAFLVVGSKFHAIGVAISTGKPTVMANPYEQVAEDVSREARLVLARRYASIEEARGAGVFGVIIGLKPGQMKMGLALRAKELLEEEGREAILLALREIRPENLADFRGIDAFVNTACPRLSLEDDGAFGRPMLTFPELLVALGRLRWEELCEAGWFAAPGW